MDTKDAAVTLEEKGGDSSGSIMDTSASASDVEGSEGGTSGSDSDSGPGCQACQAKHLRICQKSPLFRKTFARRYHCSHDGYYYTVPDE